MSAWPSIWRLVPDVLFPRSLDLAAIVMKLMAVKLKFWIQSFKLGTEAKVRNETNHLVWVSCILIKLFGTPFICHQWGSFSDVGTPPTWQKGSHLPPGTNKLGNLRDSHNPPQIPLPKPDLWDSSSLCQAHPGIPEM